MCQRVVASEGAVAVVKRLLAGRQSRALCAPAMAPKRKESEGRPSSQLPEEI